MAKKAGDCSLLIYLILLDWGFRAYGLGLGFRLQVLLFMVEESLETWG